MLYALQFTGSYNNNIAVLQLEISLVPWPEEEEKGPGFSHSHMRLIISDLGRC